MKKEMDNDYNSCFANWISAFSIFVFPRSY